MGIKMIDSKKVLAEILTGIEDAATEGYHSADYYSNIFACHKNIQDYVIQSLRDGEFEVSHIDKGIRINWV